MDFTPGIFEIDIPSKPKNRVNTTLAKQLAYYVIIYSPLQMVADLPENYIGRPAFQFIKDVPCDWQETRVLNGVIGDYVTIVRKDRNSDDWYLGSITDENPRKFKFELNFLDKNTNYTAQIYADGKNADWISNPLPVDIQECIMTSKDTLFINLAPGGGQAVRFTPIEIKKLSE
jgi:alpha-glucosidase